MAKKMAKTTQERRADRLRIEASKRLLQQQLEEAEMLLKDESEATPESDDAPDTVEKDYNSDYYPAPSGPTSFEELDAAQQAQAQSRKISEVGWDTQMLVRNIINHPMMDAKGKAGAIKEVGSGLEKRISSIFSEVETVKKDMDVLTIEAIVAHDSRQSSPASKVWQFIQKATLSTEQRNDLSDTDFALVKEMDGKKVRKYPVHDAAHTRNALARAAQEINAGGQAAVDAKEALPRIRQAAKKFGIDVTMKKDKNAIIVQKDDAGDWRWIGWVSNNFEDTDHDIIAEIAHKEYVSYLDANPAMAPMFMSWHTPGTSRESLPDFWGYESGFLMMSGKLTEKEAETLLKASALTDLGMSHLSLVLARDKKNPRIVTKYRMCEASDLPLANAANPFTALDTLSKEADMDAKTYLTELFGKEKADSLLAGMDVTQKDLKNAGVVSKSKSDAAPEEKPVDSVVPDHVMKEIMEKLDIPGLNEFVVKANDAIEKVPVLEALVKQLANSNDDNLAEKIAPPAATLAWSIQKNRASQDPDTVVEEGDALLKNKPTADENWLSEATHTKPILSK